MTTKAPLDAILSSLRDPHDDDELFDAMSQFAASRGLTLYPAQEEALLEVLSGNHVIMATPTGSGKSLVAMAAHFVALCAGGNARTTRPH